MNNTINFGTFKRLINLSDYAVPVTKDAADIQEVYRIESIEVQAIWDLLINIFKIKSPNSLLLHWGKT